MDRRQIDLTVPEPMTPEQAEALRDAVPAAWHAGYDGRPFSWTFPEPASPALATAAKDAVQRLYEDGMADRRNHDQMADRVIEATKAAAALMAAEAATIEAHKWKG